MPVENTIVQPRRRPGGKSVARPGAYTEKPDTLDARRGTAHGETGFRNQRPRKKTHGRCAAARHDSEDFEMNARHAGTVSTRRIPWLSDFASGRALRSGAAKKAGMRLSFGGLVAFVLLLSLGGEAFASCGSSQRIWHNNDAAECLIADWDNNPWPDTTTFWAASRCGLFGNVVAKIDIRNASDKTWTLSGSSRRNGQSDNTIRGIYCCKDLSVLCQRSDVVNPQECLDQFRKSPAKQGCNLSELPTADSGEEHCNFKAWCVYDHGEYSGHSTLNMVLWYKADEMLNCNGVLKRAGGC